MQERSFCQWCCHDVVMDDVKVLYYAFGVYFPL